MERITASDISGGPYLVFEVSEVQKWVERKSMQRCCFITAH